MVIILKVKLFDCEDEGDLEEDINSFLLDDKIEVGITNESLIRS